MSGGFFWSVGIRKRSFEDMGLEDARVSATVATEQIPQMVMQAMYFRFSLDNLSQQARIKQWVSMSMSVAVMLLKLQKRGRRSAATLE